MKSVLNVLVLGGNGFIGRHAVAALRGVGHRVIVGSRTTGSNRQGTPLDVNPALEMRQVRLHQLLEAEDWMPLIRDVDVVLNCVGILRERPGESYDTVHHRGPAALARACARSDKRLLHVSALGLSSQARSRFIRSKLQGEQALRDAAPDCVIVRPSLLDGDGGFGAGWLRALARFPVHVVPGGPGAHARMAPLSARDLGEALARLCVRSHGSPTTLDFGGPASLSMREYLSVLRPARLGQAWCLVVPRWLARIGSHVCDLFHWSPYSFGHFELMSKDNLPKVNALPAVLGRAPVAIGAAPSACDAGTGTAQWHPSLLAAKKTPPGAVVNRRSPRAV
ncbi:MAG: NAD-dependent epimerase/dehydratase family protein [bacterium]|jgi:NADH dehydrogenase|nr:NAD-dependent epimerase/dehydratase family protein [Betaproteobacteria bacterium]